MRKASLSPSFVTNPTLTRVPTPTSSAGGGWCYDAGDCFGRSSTNLGSSKNYPATAKTVSGGIMSQDCDVNPQFCNWNFVYLK